MHALCDHDPCCCGGAADLDTLFRHHAAADRALDREIAHAYGLDAGAGLDEGGGDREERAGDSGYIAAEAWGSTANIGELADPLSTGRKRQARMYPITKGTVCEWAGKLVKLGDLPVVVGCINSPATDLHHGPDKNTLNNEKATAGVGATENTHVICSECHNSLHGKHDPFYPPYDRVDDQARPWMPKHIEYGAQYELVDALIEQLFEEEQRRKADRERRGRKTRGRKARTQEKGDFHVHEEG